MLSFGRRRATAVTESAARSVSGEDSEAPGADRTVGRAGGGTAAERRCQRAALRCRHDAFRTRGRGLARLVGMARCGARPARGRSRGPPADPAGPRRQAGAAGRQTHVRDIVDEVERLDPRDVVPVGHRYAGIPVGQAAERIGDRLARVVFVDSNVPADGASFVSGWPDGRAGVEAAIAANGGFWPPPAAADCADQGLTVGALRGRGDAPADREVPARWPPLPEDRRGAGRPRHRVRLPARWWACGRPGPTS